MGDFPGSSRLKFGSIGATQYRTFGSGALSLSLADSVDGNPVILVPMKIPAASALIIKIVKMILLFTFALL